MAWVILFSIIALPVVEIAIFIKVADVIGTLAAVAGAVLAGIAGVALWRHEGLRTVLRAQQALNRGEAPVAEVFDGLCLVLAGGLLLLPGFLSDGVALVLLLPPVRYWLRGLVTSRMVVATVPSSPPPESPSPAAPFSSSSSPLIIDAEYRDVSDASDVSDDDRPRP